MSKIANISDYKARKLRQDARAILRGGKENIPLGTGELGTKCIHQILGEDVNEIYNVSFFGPNAMLYAELYQSLRPSVILDLVYPINNQNHNLAESITLEFILETIEKVKATSRLRLVIVDSLPSVFDDSAKKVAGWDYSHGFNGDHVALANFYVSKDPKTMLAVLEHARYLCLKNLFRDKELRRDAKDAIESLRQVKRERDSWAGRPD